MNSTDIERAKRIAEGEARRQREIERNKEKEHPSFPSYLIAYLNKAKKKKWSNIGY